jgi:hypothetical protein
VMPPINVNLADKLMIKFPFIRLLPLAQLVSRSPYDERRVSDLLT